MNGIEDETLSRKILGALSSVTDPEIDEPITDLGFVKNVSVEDGIVSVQIVTSTFWCSPNFVYMMLEDARDALVGLPGVRGVRVLLEGHHDAMRINEGVNSGKSFSDCYGPEASGDIAELNRVFREKALRSRLHGLVAALAKSGLAAEELVGLKLGDVSFTGNTFRVKSDGRSVEVEDPADAVRIERYLTFLQKLDLRDAPLVIQDLQGNPPKSGEFDSFLGRGRSTKLSFGLNAELCRALLKSRIDREQSPVLESGIRKPG